MTPRPRYPSAVRTTGLLACVTAALWLLGGVAHAGDPKREEAARIFAAGDQAYASGQNLAAARAYERAYELTPLPAITFSIAQAYRRHYFEDPNVQWLEKSQALYQRYLREEPQGPRRAHAVTHLANIATLLAEHASKERGEGMASALSPTEFLVSSVTPGAVAQIDDGPPQPVPLVQRVLPGPHRVKVSAPGYFELDQEVEATEGRMIIIPTELRARPGTLRVDTDPDADVWIDGRLVARGDKAKAIDLPAGNPLVSVTAFGRRADARSVRVDRGRIESVRIDLETSDQRVASYWLFGTSGALTIGGAAMAILAAVSESRVTSERAGLLQGRALTPEQARESNEALETRDLARGLAVGGFAGGALVGLTGTFVFVFDSAPPAAAPAADTATSFGLSLRGAY